MGSLTAERTAAEELEGLKALFSGLEALLAKTEPSHLRLNKYAGQYHAGIKDTSKTGEPIYRFKADTLLSVLEELVAAVGE